MDNEEEPIATGVSLMGRRRVTGPVLSIVHCPLSIAKLLDCSAAI